MSTQHLSYKHLKADDVKTVTTLLHELIPVTGALLSGTYATSSANNRELNIKSYAHGMFQSVYDYPYLSSSANHIFDITAGFSANAASVSSSATFQVAKKVNIYNQMAQVLVGYNTSSFVRRFDNDGNLDDASGKMDDMFFMNFARLLTKDEIKKGTFETVLGTNNSYGDPFGTTVTITDADSANNFRSNSPAGEYGFLKTKAQAASATLSSENDSGAGQTISFIALKADGTLEAAETFTAINGANAGNNFNRQGVDAGLSNLKNRIEANADIKDLVTVSAITRPGGNSGPYVMTITQNHAGAAGNTTIANGLSGVSINGGANDADGAFTGGVTGGTTTGLVYYQAGIVAFTSSVFGDSAQIMNNATSSNTDVLKKASVDNFADGVRNRVSNIKFTNTTELSSTIYNCNIGHNDFNYSSNPTYVKNSKIVVKTNPGGEEASLPPITYITTVGLYSANNELMAVAKLSEPLRNDPTISSKIRVRLDF